MNPFTSIVRSAAGWLRTATGYDSAKFNRAFRNWRPSFGSPDGEIIKDLPTLRARSRDLYKNNAVARGAIRLMVSNVVGRGLKLQAAVDRDVIQKYFGWSNDDAAIFFNKLETRIESRFRLWAESKESDARGQRTFYENTALAFNSVLQSGEVFATLPIRQHANKMFRLRVGLIEADQVQSPTGGYYDRRNRDGLVTAPDGTPLGIYVNRNQETYPYEYEYIPFFGKHSGRPMVLHLYKADRPGQSRGVPFLAPVIQVLKHLEDYKKSELIRAKVVSYFSVFIKSPNPHALDGNGIVSKDEQDSESVAAEGKDYTLSPGVVMQLGPGEEVQFANPGNISSNYGPFSESLNIEIGMALGIPYEILRRYFAASYSATRGAVVEFQKEVRVSREWLEFEWCAPIYREWLTEEVLSGAIDMPGFFTNMELQTAYLGSTWTGEAMGLIDATKEIQASDMRVAGGYSNKTEETAALTGGDYSRNLIILKREAEMRKIYGLDSVNSNVKPLVENAPAPPVDGENQNNGDGQNITTPEART